MLFLSGILTCVDILISCNMQILQILYTLCYEDTLYYITLSFVVFIAIIIISIMYICDIIVVILTDKQSEFYSAFYLAFSRHSKTY